MSYQPGAPGLALRPGKAQTLPIPISSYHQHVETHHEAALLAPGLYLVATPIGNLGDITLRALDVLRRVDRIACEDTRQTQKLLNHFGIATPTESYHLHNESTRSEELLEQLK